MEAASKHQAKKITSAQTCTVHEYVFKNKALDCALIKIRGRYPERGVALNEECSEIAFVKDGRGRVVINNIGFPLHKESVVLIEPKEKFYWEGKLTLIMSCAPAWRKEQYKII